MGLVAGRLQLMFEFVVARDELFAQVVPGAVLGVLGALRGGGGGGRFLSKGLLCHAHFLVDRRRSRWGSGLSSCFRVSVSSQPRTAGRSSPPPRSQGKASAHASLQRSPK